MRFRVNGKTVRVTQRRGTDFLLEAPLGASVIVEPGAARDRYGNTVRVGLTLQ